MPDFKLIIFITFNSILLGTLNAGCLQAQNLNYTGNMQYSTGTYFFEESTESFSLVNGLGWSGDQLNITLNVPFIVQNSPWISYGIAGSLPTGGPEHKTVRDSSASRGSKGQDGKKNMMSAWSSTDNLYRLQEEEDVIMTDTSSYTQSSFGDPNLYANVRLYFSDTGETSLWFNTGVKFPLADPTSGFGTGEWDYGVGISASQHIAGLFFIADVMKWWFGDLQDLELQNPFSYSLGIGKSFSNGDWMINGSFNGYTEIIDNYDPPMNVGLGLGYFATDWLSLNSSFTLGLAESSSDFSMGFGWSIKL